MSDSRHRIVKIDLDERTVVRRNPDVEHERAVAIFDLLEENQFAPVGEFAGPYHLNLSIEENRLVLDIRAEDGGAAAQGHCCRWRRSARIVKDYFTVCESYYAAIKGSACTQIEAIDMGRRGLHDEGSELLRERLEGKVASTTAPRGGCSRCSACCIFADEATWPRHRQASSSPAPSTPCARRWPRR